MGKDEARKALTDFFKSDEETNDLVIDELTAETDDCFIFSCGSIIDDSFHEEYAVFKKNNNIVMIPK